LHKSIDLVIAVVSSSASQLHASVIAECASYDLRLLNMACVCRSL
jgi:hypothetical protein